MLTLSCFIHASRRHSPIQMINGGEAVSIQSQYGKSIKPSTAPAPSNCVMSPESMMSRLSVSVLRPFDDVKVTVRDSTGQLPEDQL